MELISTASSAKPWTQGYRRVGVHKRITVLVGYLIRRGAAEWSQHPLLDVHAEVKKATQQILPTVVMAKQ